MDVDQFVDSLGDRAKLPLIVTEDDWHKAYIEIFQHYTELRNKYETFRGIAYDHIKIAAQTLDAAQAEICVWLHPLRECREHTHAWNMIQRIRGIEKGLRSLITHIENTSTMKPGE